MVLIKCDCGMTMKFMDDLFVLDAGQTAPPPITCPSCRENISADVVKSVYRLIKENAARHNGSAYILPNDAEIETKVTLQL